MSTRRWKHLKYNQRLKLIRIYIEFLIKYVEGDQVSSIIMRSRDVLVKIPSLVEAFSIAKRLGNKNLNQVLVF